MNTKNILSMVDHTQLSQTATWDQIKTLCDEAIEYNVASICIPPSYVKDAKDYVENKVKICTVIGFPNGYNTTRVKVLETEDAIKNGADEIDMVINLGMLKDKKYLEIEDEIRNIKEVCNDKILKVIIETCLLTDDEKIKMCDVVTKSGADYIKTSTGFSTSGATFDDIKLFSKYVGKDIGIKAAGGIKSISDAEKFIMLGANRLGTSRMIKIIKEENK